jgi:serine/threonine protein kinase
MLAPETILQNRYRIVRKIGQGGMGAVYEAIDQRFNSRVALKQSLVSDHRLGKAFEREARTLNALRHPALPVVSDYFNEGEAQFLVMQFVSGDDLGTILGKRKERVAPVGVPKPFEPEEVLDWADQMLDALDYLHTQQPPIIHRDIKPQNLKLAGRGQIVLLDFGLAKGAPPEAARTDSSVSIFGYTPVYAPLEQMKGAGTDPRSDLYSLAATVYHLLTGYQPPDALTRVADITDGQVDPLRPIDKLNPAVPPSVAALFSQAMSLNRDMRPPSAADMRKILRMARGDNSSFTSSPEQPTVLTRPAASHSTVPYQGETMPVTSPPFSQTASDESATVLSNAAPPVQHISEPPRKSSNKLIFIISAVILVLVLIAFGGWWAIRDTSSVDWPDPALASKDKDSPTLLKTQEIIGRGRTDDIYYSFEAGPGELLLTLNAIAGGGGVEVEVFDSQSKKMRFGDSTDVLKVWSGYEQNEQAMTNLLIDRRQTVLMRIGFSYPDVVTAYRVRIGGDVSLRKSSKVNELLSAPFAARDNPTPLLAKEVFGTGKTEDTYYAFDVEPGEINLALDVVADGGSVSIQLFDNKATRLHFDDDSTEFKIWSGYKHDERGKAKLYIDRKQRVVMRVSQTYPNSIQAYRARIDGPVASIAGSLADKSDDALSAKFMLRDNPAALQSSEIEGRGKADDIYYTFEAGPGDVDFHLNVIATGGATLIELFDEDLNKIPYEDGKNELMVWSNTNEEGQGSAKIKLDHKQRILMRISFTYSNSVGNYKLKMGGSLLTSGY